MSATDIVNQLQSWGIFEQVLLDGGNDFGVYDEENFELYLTLEGQEDILLRFLGVKHPLTLRYNQHLNDIIR